MAQACKQSHTGAAQDATVKEAADTDAKTDNDAGVQDGRGENDLSDAGGQKGKPRDCEAGNGNGFQHKAERRSEDAHKGSSRADNACVYEANDERGG